MRPPLTPLPQPLLLSPHPGLLLLLCHGFDQQIATLTSWAWIQKHHQGPREPLLPHRHRPLQSTNPSSTNMLPVVYGKSEGSTLGYRRAAKVQERGRQRNNSNAGRRNRPARQKSSPCNLASSPSEFSPPKLPRTCLCLAWLGSGSSSFDSGKIACPSLIETVRVGRLVGYLSLYNYCSLKLQQVHGHCRVPRRERDIVATVQVECDQEEEDPTPLYLIGVPVLASVKPAEVGPDARKQAWSACARIAGAELTGLALSTAGPAG